MMPARHHTIFRVRNQRYLPKGVEYVEYRG